VAKVIRHGRSQTRGWIGFVRVTESEQAALAGVFADIARRLQAETSPEGAQDRVTRAAVTTVEGCDHAAISIIRRWGGLQTVSATDDVPQRVDAIQYAAGDGPCLDVLAEQQTYVIDDLAATSGGRRSPAGRSRRPGCAARCRFGCSCRATRSAR
jgi:hypothetical protein